MPVLLHLERLNVNLTSMANQKLLYATCGTVLAFSSFILATVTIALPIWAYFEDQRLGFERGYFSPWKTCVYGLHRTDRCGPNETHFRPSISIWLAGISAYFGAATLAFLCVLSVLQLAMINSREKLFMDYYLLIVLKLACGLLSAILNIITAGMFASQIDSSDRVFITRGPAFYIEICLVGCNLFLLAYTIYDVIFTKKPNGDPTKKKALSSVAGNKFVKNNNGIAVTRASGKPYIVKESMSNGSMASMSTVLSNVSTIDSASTTIPTRSPLRSSLKKPSVTNGMHSGSLSPNGHQRNGSIKKVRIQTHSTEV